MQGEENKVQELGWDHWKKKMYEQLLNAYNHKFCGSYRTIKGHLKPGFATDNNPSL